MREHPITGEKLCRPLEIFPAIRRLIRSHHERWNGSGSPEGLRGDDIPLATQLLALADVWDALTRKRPYRRALAPDEARETINTSTVAALSPGF